MIINWQILVMFLTVMDILEYYNYQIQLMPAHRLLIKSHLKTFFFYCLKMAIVPLYKRRKMPNYQMLKLQLFLVVKIINLF